jgi:hypothetical protein
MVIYMANNFSFFPFLPSPFLLFNTVFYALSFSAYHRVQISIIKNSLIVAEYKILGRH